MSDILEVITTKTGSLLSGIAEDDGECKDPFTSVEKHTEELENDETGLDGC